ncbi:serine protease 33 isoform X1 [Hypomesus transpacificus]|uniref:serine protease 33 isoform X1 n=2 Tax=Hypomesus transpacificus TaxID=137520 RepID=UPI001F071717|nr:serine protease 33 isoform X1 [Hypomesus transpacificus]
MPTYFCVFLFWCVTGVSVSHAQECGKPPMGTRIVGGEPATDGSWPWQVDIQVNGVHVCGGSLINEQWVLSAAHCFPTPINQASYTIYAGRLQLNGFNQYETSHSMKNIMIAPGYNTPQSGNDVALVQLDPPVSWTNVIQPICIPGSGVSFSEGQSCYVTGWGDIRDGVSLPGVGTLQQVVVPIIGQTSCQNMYQTDADILSDMICAGYQAGAKDSCQGDSGGPLVCQMANGTWVQAGVVSFGLGCAQPNHPGVYAKVSSFSDFITSIVPGLQLYGGAPQACTGGLGVLLSSLATLVTVQLLR